MSTTLESLKVLDFMMPDFVNKPQVVSRGVISRMAANPWVAANIGFASKYPRHALNFTFKFSDTDLSSSGNLHKMIDFFDDHSGRHKSFWIPSYIEELSPASDAVVTTLDIKQVGYDAVYLQATSEVTRLGNYVFLLDRDGTVNYRKVTSATSGGDPEILSFSTSLSTSFTQGQFILGFLYHVRFNTDELVIDYHKNGVASTDLSFIEVYDVTSEADA